ncbi:MAG: endolytic transglycosylase MltG [Fimbriimonas sp.]|nr:endolytic transglycosylase MltG [Fimbriimonas sp.]
MSKRRRRKQGIVFVLILGLAFFGVWLIAGVRPAGTPEASKTYLRFEKQVPLSEVLKDLQKRGILRSASATGALAWLIRMKDTVDAGSYAVGPGQNGGLILWALHKPIRQILRLPETNWANRTANLLAQHHVASASEYMELVHDPRQFAGVVDFPLPSDSLEGYLYPDRYELPPLLGAKQVILKQLKEFEEKVWQGAERPKDLKRTLILASLVQLEAGKDVDRAMIAGVIENRIKRKMPLQIDATIEYALQKWRRLTFKDYRNVKSPYNTYLVKGLPPGPICSPDAKDIDAAMHPAKHNYLFYVALPNGETIYSATYKEHLKNIKLRRAALKATSS